MGGIAEQRDATGGPAFERRSHHERPFVWRVDRANKSLNVVVPAAEIASELLLRTAGAPRFDLPVAALEDADEIHQLSGPQRIVNDVAAGSDPVRTDHPRHMPR